MQAGVVLLVETVVRKTDLDAAVSAALAPWRKARAVQSGLSLASCVHRLDVRA